MFLSLSRCSADFQSAVSQVFNLLGRSADCKSAVQQVTNLRYGSYDSTPLLIFAVKKKKKKIALPRRQWQINPVTRVKHSARTYSRPRAKLHTRKDLDA